MAGYEGIVVLNYRLQRKLGEGGFGAVFLAEHTELGRKAACKILHREFADQPELVERFFREAKAVCAIGHRAIVQIENFGRLADGEPYYLMELIVGETLAARVKRAPLSPAQAIAVFEPVASALTAAHARQIIHRDLKPENIMVREEGGRIAEVKLLDFGIAKLIGEADAVRSRSGVPMGTPAYMPPEQALDSKSVDRRGDVYSFAATVYAAMSGRPPFWADSVAGVLLKVQLEPPAPFLAPNAPVGLGPVLARCLAKAPAERPPSIEAAWAAIRAVLEGAPADASMGLAATMAPPNLVATVAPITAVPPAAGAPGAVTTLGSAAGEPSLATAPRRRARRWPWVATAAVAAGGALAYVIAGGASPARPAAVAAEVVRAPAIVDRSAGAPADAAPEPWLVAPADASPPAAAAPWPVVAVVPDRPRRGHRDRLAPAPAPSQAPPPGPPPAPSIDCSMVSFARVYDAPSPSESEINGALARLKRCQGQLAAEKFKQIQRNLVSRL